MSHHRPRVGLGMLLLAVASCIDSTGPRSGVLSVSLTTPNAGADGAILLTVTGPAAPTSVAPAAGLRLFSLATLGTTNHFAVTGQLASRPVLTLGVADVNQARQYVATIQEVAATTYQLRVLSGYALTVSPQ